MKLRLHGTRGEVTEATGRLVQVLEVVAVSQPYPDRGAIVRVRVYLEVRLPEASWSTGTSPGFPGRLQGSGPGAPAAAPGGGGDEAADHLRRQDLPGRLDRQPPRQPQLARAVLRSADIPAKARNSSSSWRKCRLQMGTLQSTCAHIVVFECPAMLADAEVVVPSKPAARVLGRVADGGVARPRW